MKLITAIIRLHKLDDVRAALSELGVSSMTVSEVKGFGRQRGHTELYRGAEYAVEFVPKTRVDVAVPDTLIDQVIEAISSTARTGKVGDGKVFISELKQVVRIRTGERDARQPRCVVVGGLNSARLLKPRVRHSVMEP